MRTIPIAIVASMLMLGPFAVVRAEEQTSWNAPQSIRLQREQIVNRLASFAKRKGAVGASASKALAVLQEHYAKEAAFVLPPLSLLPRIANDEASRDMAPAIAMADRTRAALPEFHNDHIQITSLMNELIEAGKNTRDDELVRLATRIAAQSLNDIEVVQPTTIMIGNYLRQRLPKAE
jgi:hypothetical protein